MAKIKEGKLRICYETIDLKQLLDEIISLFQIQIQQKNLDLRIDIFENTPKTIRTDPIRFKQILLNLLSNALKFTFNGFIRLKIKQKFETNNELLKVSVQDSGIGIKVKHLKGLFREFGIIEDSRSFNKSGKLKSNF